MPPQNQSITKHDFESWLVQTLNTNKPPSLRKVASYGALSKSTLAYQMKNDAIDPTVVISVARGIGKNPITELGRFKHFSFLPQMAQTPASDTEILYALATPDVLREILQRYSATVESFSITPVSPAQIWGRWFRACTQDASGRKIHEITGFSSTSISRNQQMGTWGIEQIFNLSKHFHFHLLVALVVSGFITWKEAGYTEKRIEERLKGISEDLLAEYLSSLAPGLPRDLELHRDNQLRTLSIEYLA